MITDLSGSFPHYSVSLVFLRHAHYQTGNTPLALVWKDNYCSQYVLDTDSQGLVPTQQQVQIAYSFVIHWIWSSDQFNSYVRKGGGGFFFPVVLCLFRYFQLLLNKVCLDQV